MRADRLSIAGTTICVFSGILEPNGEEDGIIMLMGRRSARWSWAVFAAGVCCAGAGHAQENTNPPADPSPDAPSMANPAGVCGLVEQLGHPDFQVRQEATKSLLALGPAAFGTLAAEYRRLDDYEIRMRIREIVEEAYLQDRVLGRHGFLGIQPHVEDLSKEARFDGLEIAVRIVRVVPGSAAERAGLLDGDFIVRLNGQTFDRNLNAADFANRLRDAGPGAKLELTVFRDNDLMDIPVVLGNRPLEHYFGPSDNEYVQKLQTALQGFQSFWAGEFEPPPLPTTVPSRLPTTLRLPKGFDSAPDSNQGSGREPGKP